MGSAHATVIPISLAGEFKPAKVRLITGETELLARLEVIGMLEL